MSSSLKGKWSESLSDNMSGRLSKLSLSDSSLLDGSDVWSRGWTDVEGTGDSGVWNGDAVEDMAVWTGDTGVWTGDTDAGWTGDAADPGTGWTGDSSVQTGDSGVGWTGDAADIGAGWTGDSCIWTGDTGVWTGDTDVGWTGDAADTGTGWTGDSGVWTIDPCVQTASWLCVLWWWTGGDGVWHCQAGLFHCHCGHWTNTHLKKETLPVKPFVTTSITVYSAFSSCSLSKIWIFSTTLWKKLGTSFSPSSLSLVGT